MYAKQRNNAFPKLRKKSENNKEKSAPPGITRPVGVLSTAKWDDGWIRQDAKRIQDAFSKPYLAHSCAKVGTWDAQGSCINMRLASLIGLKVGLTAIMDTYPL